MNVRGFWLASEWASSGRRDLIHFLVGLKSFRIAKCQPSSLLVKLVCAWKIKIVSFFESHICNFCRKGLLFVILSWISKNMNKYSSCFRFVISKFNLHKQITSPWSVNWRGVIWNYLWSSSVGPESVLLLAFTSFICRNCSSSKW